MNNDRELLKLAAKAAGMSELIWMTKWKPLTDDGDALRLAVKLQLFSKEVLDENISNAVFFDDPYAATRRAIVMAAAEIGKDMK